MFCDSAQLGSNDALIVRPEITTPADLPGKTIATPRGSTSHYQLINFLKLLNLDKLVTVRTAQPSEFAELWRTGGIDGVFVWSPHLQALRTTFDARTLITGTALGDLGAPTALMYVAHIAPLILRLSAIFSLQIVVHLCRYMLRRNSLPFSVVRDVLRTILACNDHFHRHRWGQDSPQVCCGATLMTGLTFDM